MMSFGLTNQVLTLYLKELHISEPNIGLFMSLTMIGDSVLSYFLTWNSNKIGNRRVMIIGSVLMFLSGGVFASGTSNFTILLVASVLGVISPSGNETGPFKSIEEAVLAKLTPPNHRPEIYAIHWVLAAAGSSIGSLCAGALIQTLTSKYEFSFARAYRTAFIFYCGISVVKATSMLFLTGKCEASYIPKFEQEQQQQIPELEHDALLAEEGPSLISSSHPL
ncbi:unnamed protein product [Ambrosiozyma monospora]|uniref:Unnamed protein product n=1 Tax=Ambrosiozyma monospora TaxID=43982 RepID=A0A9W7DGS3_AMBMO|nr:unnamed protein product [Ambrosiozyma monospora]